MGALTCTSLILLITIVKYIYLFIQSFRLIKSNVAAALSLNVEEETSTSLLFVPSLSFNCLLSFSASFFASSNWNLKAISSATESPCYQ